MNIIKKRSWRPLGLLLLWGLGRWTFRRREDMVTEDSARNQTLLRVRRLY